MNAHHHTVHLARRGILTAVAVAITAIATSTLFASATWAASDSEAFSRIGASFPVADFAKDTSTAVNTWSRASAFASVLAGEAVPAAGSALKGSPAQAQFQVRTQGGIRYLAEATRDRAAAYYDPLASDAEVAARAIATAVTPDRLERISVIVDNERRDLLAVNGAVADDFASRWDVGPERAKAIFDATVQSLSANRLAADEGLAPEAVRTHRLMQGERAAGQPAITRVKEYLYEVPHAVGGIEIFGAATTIAVHRSGQLAAIRSTGPSVGTAATGAMVTRQVSNDTLTQRANAEHPNAKIVPVGLRYPWQATRDAALASRPREVFQVIPTSEVEGRAVNGRAHFVFYSVEDERAAPLVWPEANASATGDVRQ